MTPRLAWLSVALFLSALLWVGSARAACGVPGPWTYLGETQAGESVTFTVTRPEGTVAVEWVGCEFSDYSEPYNGGGITFDPPEAGPYSFVAIGQTPGPWGPTPIALEWFVQFTTVDVPEPEPEPEPPQLAADTYVLALAGLAGAFWLSFVAGRLR